MKKFDITLQREITMSQDDIDDIVCTALEGGITWWCCKAEVVENEYYGEYASDQISRGGSLRLYDIETEESYLLTLEKLLEGIKTAYAQGYLEHLFDDDGNLDFFQIDGAAADVIVQCALFGEVQFG